MRFNEEPAGGLKRASSAQLRPALSWFHLIALGVGAIVGTGIYTLTGVGAGLAGPSVILAFALCGAVCLGAALSYAEAASIFPSAGSAYSYTFTVFGELSGWLVGWSLILEYTVAASAVSVGWSAHANDVLAGLHLALPSVLSRGPGAGGYINLPAVVISILVTASLISGTRKSAIINSLFVVLKLLALLAFIVFTLPAIHGENFRPFAPYGLFAQSGSDGVRRGLCAAAAVVFFAFYGFDAVSAASEEAKRPGRDIAVGIVGSMMICTTLYIIVAFVAVGARPFHQLAASSAPLVETLQALNHPLVARLIAIAVVVSLPSAILALMYGQSRLFFAMARDHLLPKRLSVVHSGLGTPVRMIVLTGVSVATLSGLFTLRTIAELANAGTLLAFIAVCSAVLVIRFKEPKRDRPFRAPFLWIAAPICIVGCMYLLFAALPVATILRFAAWNAIGLLVYFTGRLLRRPPTQI